MSEAGSSIDYEVVRSDRKTASISVERDGRVLVRAPKSLTEDQIRDLVESRRYWIHKSLTEWRSLNAAQVQREYVNGEGFLYLGRSYRLKLVPGQKEPLKLKNGRFCLRVDGQGQPLEDPEEAFKQFYREKGRERIPGRVAYFKERMGVEPKAVRVMELGYRWASCSGHGVNFHWKAMMAPPNVLDYIVVHELAHLNYPNHTESFWRQVSKVLPEYLAYKGWLAKNGAGMDL